LWRSLMRLRCFFKMYVCSFVVKLHICNLDNKIVGLHVVPNLFKMTHHGCSCIVILIILNI
jgi:hypothetical protein